MYHALVLTKLLDLIDDPRLRAGDQPFAAYKRIVDQYVDSEEFFHLRQNPNFNEFFRELELHDVTRQPIDWKDVESHFATPNRSASLAVCQLAALALKVDIHVQCLLESEPRILLGGLPNDPNPRRTVNLLLREGGVPIYDASFVEIGHCGGHYWFVHEPEGAHGDAATPVGESRPPASSSSLPSPPLEVLGNGQGSELPRP